MNTLMATIQYNQDESLGDGLTVKIYKMKRGEHVSYAVCFLVNDALMQYLDSFKSYGAAANAAFEWLNNSEFHQ